MFKKTKGTHIKKGVGKFLILVPTLRKVHYAFLYKKCVIHAQIIILFSNLMM